MPLGSLGIADGCFAFSRVHRERPLPFPSTGSNGHGRDSRPLIEADVEIAFGNGDRTGRHSGRFCDDRSDLRQGGLLLQIAVPLAPTFVSAGYSSQRRRQKTRLSVVATVAIRPRAIRKPVGRSSSGMVLKFMPKMPDISVAGMKMTATTVSARTS